MRREARVGDGSGRRIGDVQQRHRDGARDRRRDLVHRVRADDQEVGAGGFDGPRGVGKDLAGLHPVAGVLQPFDVVKVDAVKNDPCRVEAAQRLADRLVDDPIIGNRRFPAHAAEQSDRLHARFRVRVPGIVARGGSRQCVRRSAWPGPAHGCRKRVSVSMPTRGDAVTPIACGVAAAGSTVPLPAQRALRRCGRRRSTACRSKSAIESGAVRRCRD